MCAECPICYEHLLVYNNIPCGHHIHEDCIIKSGKAECPICRRSVPELINKVNPISLEEPSWGLMDRLVGLGWLRCSEITIIDDLHLPEGDDVLLVKAVLLLYALKQVFGLIVV